jgi:hypothetical protein
MSETWRTQAIHLHDSSLPLRLLMATSIFSHHWQLPRIQILPPAEPYHQKSSRFPHSTKAYANTNSKIMPRDPLFQREIKKPY